MNLSGAGLISGAKRRPQTSAQALLQCLNRTGAGGTTYPAIHLSHPKIFLTDLAQGLVQGEVLDESRHGTGTGRFRR